MSLWVGLAGTRRNACVTLRSRDAILGICEQERITRVRGAGVNGTGLPDEALDELLARSGNTRHDVTGYAVADGRLLPDGPEPIRVDGHFAQASAAFLSSPFDSAMVVICDEDAPRVSTWVGNGTAITRLDRPWNGPGFYEIYAQCAAALGFPGSGGEQRMEALARLNPLRRDGRADELFALSEDGLRASAGWASRLRDWAASAGADERPGIAAAVQSRLGECLLELIEQVRGLAPSARSLCASGGLFSNSHFNSLIKQRSSFDEVFVPISPGSAGRSLGAASSFAPSARLAVSPFLGPSYTAEEIKSTLDNCKLTYQWASDNDAVAIVVDSLKKGRLVGLFDGAMEWGPRALGRRSIVANPFAPYALDHLNRFLKQRDTWRGYALSGLDAAVQQHFDGPTASPFMECDYAPKDRDLFRHVLPGPLANVRIQTVGPDAPARFQAVLRAFGQETGVPVVVNTSFNGFREPIVCSPRDAIRVFYGTGIDVLVLGQFVIRK